MLAGTDLFPSRALAPGRMKHQARAFNASLKSAFATHSCGLESSVQQGLEMTLTVLALYLPRHDRTRSSVCAVTGGKEGVYTAIILDFALQPRIVIRRVRADVWVPDKRGTIRSRAQTAKDTAGVAARARVYVPQQRKPVRWIRWDATQRRSQTGIRSCSQIPLE